MSQPTLQSATLTNGALQASHDRPDGIDVPLAGGDGTVPPVSATPIELSDEARETFLGERHAALQNNEYALDDVRERIKQLHSTGLGEIQGTWRAGQPPVISLGLEDLYLPDEPVELHATVANGDTPKGLIAHRAGGGRRARAVEHPYLAKELPGSQEQLHLFFTAREVHFEISTRTPA